MCLLMFNHHTALSVNFIKETLACSTAQVNEALLSLTADRHPLLRGWPSTPPNDAASTITLNQEYCRSFKDTLNPSVVLRKVTLLGSRRRRPHFSLSFSSLFLSLSLSLSFSLFLSSLSSLSPLSSLFLTTLIQPVSHDGLSWRRRLIDLAVMRILKRVSVQSITAKVAVAHETTEDAAKLEPHFFGVDAPPTPSVTSGPSFPASFSSWPIFGSAVPPPETGLSLSTTSASTASTGGVQFDSTTSSTPTTGGLRFDSATSSTPTTGGLRFDNTPSSTFTTGGFQFFSSSSFPTPGGFQFDSTTSSTPTRFDSATSSTPTTGGLRFDSATSPLPGWTTTSTVTNTLTNTSPNLPGAANSNNGGPLVPNVPPPTADPVLAGYLNMTVCITRVQRELELHFAAVASDIECSINALVKDRYVELKQIKNSQGVSMRMLRYVLEDDDMESTNWTAFTPTRVDDLLVCHMCAMPCYENSSQEELRYQFMFPRGLPESERTEENTSTSTVEPVEDAPKVSAMATPIWDNMAGTLTQLNLFSISKDDKSEKKQEVEEVKVKEDGIPKVRPVDSQEKSLALGDDGVMQRMIAATQPLVEAFGLEPGQAMRVLLTCGWSKRKSLDRYLETKSLLRNKAGLPPPRAQGPLSQISPITVEKADCLVCFEEFPQTELFSLWCGHAFCKPCWIQHIEAISQDSQRVSSRACMQFGCSAGLTLECVRDILGDNAETNAIYKRFARGIVQHFVSQSAELFCCKNPKGCDRVIVRTRGTLLVCDACGFAFPTCDYPVH